MCNPSTCECVLIRSVKLMNIQIFKVIYSKIVSLNYVKINSVNPLYLIIYNINVEENRGNKHLKVVPTNESKGAPKKCEELCNKIRDLIRSITNSLDNYNEKLQKSNLILMIYLQRKTQELHNMITSVRSAFYDGNKYYPHFFRVMFV